MMPAAVIRENRFQLGIIWRLGLIPLTSDFAFRGTRWRRSTRASEPLPGLLP